MEGNAGLDYISFSNQMESIGVKHIVFTDIETDGTLSGPSYERLEALQKAVSCSITASGGVSSNEDLRRLGEGGLCQMCERCHFPNCTFGRY